jgi:large subunit ribosomal protein L15
MDLSNLSPAPGATKKRKRVGRGPGSGHGKTSCRGHKGRGARSGGSTPPGYEGGQMPLQRRLPKHGFRNPTRREFAIVNLATLEERFEAGATVDPAQLLERRMIRGRMPVKILAEGQLTKALTVHAHKFSEAAKQRIEAVGGRVEVIVGA